MATTKLYDSKTSPAMLSTGTGTSITGPYTSKEYELAMQQAQFDMAMAQRRIQMETEAKQNAEVFRFTIEVAENGYYMLRFQGRLLAVKDPQELGETIIGSIASTKF